MHKYIVILSLLISGWLGASEPFYYQYDQSKGLSSKNVYDIHKDQKGFIWFATDDGLTRFDGQNFVTYTHELQSMKAGSCIKEDKYGRIWYKNFDGSIYYIENDSLKSVGFTKNWEYLPFGIIQNYLYNLEQDGVSQYDLKTLKKVRHFSLNTSNVSSVYADSTGFYVFSEMLFHFTDNKVKSYAIPLKISISGGIHLVIKYKDYLVLAPKKTGSYTLFKNGTFTEKTYSVKNSFLQNIQVAANKLFFCTANGFLIHNNIERQPDIKQYLSHLNTTCLLSDDSGGMWLGTLGNGVVYIPDLNTQFRYFDTGINRIQTTQNGLFVGMDNDKVLFMQNFEEEVQEFYSGNSGHGVYLLKYFETQKQYAITSDKFKITDYRGNVLCDENIAIKDICETANKLYAFAASGFCGFLSYNDSPRGGASLAPHPEKQIRFFPVVENVRGKSVAFDVAEQKVYFATNRGLFAWKNNKLQNIVSSKGEPLLFNQIISWKGRIWGVKESGALYTLSDGKFLKNEDFFYANKAIRVRKLKILDGRLFVISHNNLFVKNEDNDYLKCVMTLNPDISLRDVSLHADSLLIATSKGLIKKALYAKTSNYSPELVLNYFVINNVRYPVRTDNYRFNYNENDIRINFSIISLHSDLVRSLEYSVNGAPWVEITDQRRWLELQNLSPGKYELKFRSNNGIEQSAVQTLAFQIDQPFWFQWWFVVISVLILVTFLIYFDRWRSSRITRKNEKYIEQIQLEKSVNQMKLKALKSQMNPHFFFNALNTIQSFILQNDKMHAIKILGKFSSLTRNILEMSDKEEVGVEDEIRVLQLYLDIEKTRFNEDFEYEIKYHGFEPENVRIPSLLLQPYVENAVKHGLMHKEGLKKLIISFSMPDNVLRVTIADNGIGRKKSRELNAARKHRSFATKAIEDRIALINSYSGRQIRLTYIDELNNLGKPSGTTVVIEIIMYKFD